MNIYKRISIKKKECKNCKGKGVVIVCPEYDFKHTSCNIEDCIKCDGKGVIEVKDYGKILLNK